MNEFEVIKKYFLPLTNKSKAADFLQNDTAIINIANNQDLIISKDLMAEDVHFKKSDGAYNIASKLLKSNLSDLAASGAKPLYYMLGFSQKNDIDEDFIEEFCRGLKDAAQEFKIDLIGGDSIKTNSKLSFSLTIFGQAEKNKSLKRNTAKNKDLIFISGYIGDAFLGWQILNNKINCSNEEYRKYLINRHLQPQPRIALGRKLIEKNLAKAAIDISDGLLADLQHICDASNLDATIHQNNINISAAAQFCLKENENIDLQSLFSGGEDYELLFAVDPKNREKMSDLEKELQLPINCLGVFEEKKGGKSEIYLLDQNQQQIKILEYGWRHY